MKVRIVAVRKTVERKEIVLDVSEEDAREIGGWNKSLKRSWALQRVVSDPQPWQRSTPASARLLGTITTAMQIEADDEPE